MQNVIFDALRMYRLKCPQSDVQGNLCDLNASRANGVQNRRCEMQSGGGRGHRAALLGVDRLIPFTVGRLVVAVDIRRERHVPDSVERFVKISVLFKPDASFAECAAGNDFGGEFLGRPEQQLLADVDFLARTHQALPLIGFL